jgi:hypothetical protein
MKPTDFKLQFFSAFADWKAWVVSIFVLIKAKTHENLCGGSNLRLCIIFFISERSTQSTVYNFAQSCSFPPAAALHHDGVRGLRRARRRELCRPGHQRGARCRRALPTRAPLGYRPGGHDALRPRRTGAKHRRQPQPPRPPPVAPRSRRRLPDRRRHLPSRPTPVTIHRPASSSSPCANTKARPISRPKTIPNSILGGTASRERPARALARQPAPALRDSRHLVRAHHHRRRRRRRRPSRGTRLRRPRHSARQMRRRRAPRAAVGRPARRRHRRLRRLQHRPSRRPPAPRPAPRRLELGGRRVGRDAGAGLGGEEQRGGRGGAAREGQADGHRVAREGGRLHLPHLLLQATHLPSPPPLTHPTIIPSHAV